MRNTSHRTTIGLLLAAVALSVTACASTTAGRTVVLTPSPTAAATTSAPVRTVTVAPPKKPKSVFTKVVQAPAAPVTAASLESLFRSTTEADPAAFPYSDGVFFDSPSQNIGCYLTNDSYVTCSIHHYDFPQNGPDCSAGIAAIINSTGNPALTDCSGYSEIAHQGQVLDYGESLVNGDYACMSESSGVSCLDTATETGFTLSRQAFSPVY